MTVKEAVELFKQHQNVTVKATTRKSYRGSLERLQARFSDREVDSISGDDISRFLEGCTEALNRSTRRQEFFDILKPLQNMAANKIIR